MTEALTPIDSIIIEDRSRKDFRDIDKLAESIKDVGLILPVAVTSDNKLIDGERRIRAFKALGRTSIPARVAADCHEARDFLKAELDANVCRQEMTITEKVALAKRIEALEKPKAAERQVRAGDLGGARRPLGPTGPKGQDEDHRSDAIAASAVGVSRNTYRRARYVVEATADRDDAVREAARQAVEQMDQGCISVKAAVARVNEAAGKPTASVALVQRAPAKPKPLSIPQPPKFGGNRRKHHQMLVALQSSLDGAVLAFQGVTELDSSVTAEEASRRMADLSTSIQQINRIKNLLKERTK